MIELWEYWWPDRGETWEQANGVHADRHDAAAKTAERVVAYEWRISRPTSTRYERLALRDNSSVFMFVVEWTPEGFSIREEASGVDSLPLPVRAVRAALSPLLDEIESLRKRERDAVHARDARVVETGALLEQMHSTTSALRAVAEIAPRCATENHVPANCVRCIVNHALGRK